MNDPIFKSKDGRFWREAQYDVEVLTRNVLRIYAWVKVLDDLPPNCEKTTLSEESFKQVGEAIMKDVPSVIINGSEDDWIDEDTSGGFTIASSDPYVDQTHEAVRHFAAWVPENAQQRRFKAMIENLEMKAKNEEDEFHFSLGEATPDFQ